MDIHEVMQTAGQYCYLALTAIGEALKAAASAISEWVTSLPLPNSIKLFANENANKTLFCAILLYLLIMNIWAFSLFGSDKSKAKRKKMRVRESRLFKVCFFGGATGGLIGMNVFHHKTLKKKFSVGIPIMFVLQLLLHSFILGFVGFWTFF